MTTISQVMQPASNYNATTDTEEQTENEQGRNSVPKSGGF